MSERSEGIDDAVRAVTSPAKEGPVTVRSEGIEGTTRPVTSPTKEDS